jgi:hypothetical protein
LEIIPAMDVQEYSIKRNPGLLTADVEKNKRKIPTAKIFQSQPIIIQGIIPGLNS